MKKEKKQTDPLKKQYRLITGGIVLWVVLVGSLMLTPFGALVPWIVTKLKKDGSDEIEN